MARAYVIGWHIHRWSPWYDVATLDGIVIRQHKECRKCDKKKSHSL